MSYVLAVDGGNTKTIALVARMDGTVVGWGRAASSDIYSHATVADAMAQVAAAVSPALALAGVEPGPIQAACFSLAGADWPEDFTLLQSELESRGYAARIQVVNDAMGALRSGVQDGVGVAVVCGTGTAIGARGRDGRSWHSSFWNEQHGGLEMGRNVLRAVYRAELGIDPPTSLTRRVLDFFEQPMVEAVLHLTTSRITDHPSVAHMAKLSRLLLDEAAAGDSMAMTLVERHGRGLGDYAVAAARRVGLEGKPFKLVLSGGVFRHEASLLVDALLARIQVASPLVEPINSPFEPAVGALFLAFELAGLSVDEARLMTIETTLPPSPIFET